MEPRTAALPASPVLPPELALELDTIEAEIGRFARGELSPERFRSFRLANGIYGQRQPGVQMIRVKIPGGDLDGRQLRRLADIAEEFTPTGVSHLTTRQDVQYHFVPLERVPRLLRLLAEAGLTTREACGNSVRNVTACPVSGFIADELFDVQPYAMAVHAYLVRNPFCQQLARKFKIALSSCPEDCAATGIHDIGLVGRVRGAGGQAQPGFKVVVGGGLGSTPFPARVLDEFVPPGELLVTIRAVVKVFAEYGNRRNKMKARLKFVVHRQGIEEFRRKVAAVVAATTPGERAEAELLDYVPERDRPAVAAHLAGRLAPSDPPGQAAHPCAAGKGFDATPADAAFERWSATSVRAHRDPARAVVTVMLPLGDIEAPRLRRFAELVEARASGRARIAIDQNFVLPDVPRAGLRALHEGLAALGLAEASAGTALDVTSCPGADTCGLGITSSKGLTRAIRAELLPLVESEGLDLVRGVTIKISGCPNSCGQHHVASIGLHGVSRNVGGKQIPSYQLHLGGRIGPGEAGIGAALDKLPAKRVPAAVAALLRLYRRERADGEGFADFAARCPRGTIAAALAPFLGVSPTVAGGADGEPQDGGASGPTGVSGGAGASGPSEAAGAGRDSLEFDWGQDRPFTTEELGAGECAGAGLDVAVDPFDNFVAELEQARLFMEREQWVDALANLGRSRYTLARILLERVGKNPESDYETACELRAQVIDRGHAGELWNEFHAEVEDLLRTRRPAPGPVRALHARALELLAEAKTVLPRLGGKEPGAHAEAPG